MHFVRAQRRLNRVTGIEVFIWLMSYELQGCQLLKTPKMERSSDPLKVRETGNDFWMKIRRADLSTEIIERLATGDATVEDLHAASSAPQSSLSMPPLAVTCQHPSSGRVEVMG